MSFWQGCPKSGLGVGLWTSSVKGIFPGRGFSAVVFMNVNVLSGQGPFQCVGSSVFTSSTWSNTHVVNKSEVFSRRPHIWGCSILCLRSVFGWHSCLWGRPLCPPLRAPRPNRITTDQFKAHVKSIKSDLNQILIRFIPPSCVCPWARRKLCTLHHNVILDAVHRHKCVCVCVYPWKRWKSE